MSTPEDEVTSLMQQVADEHGLEVQLAAPSAGKAVPAGAAVAAAPQDDLAQRLANLKG
jgi:charged multivesicular body protein 1